jgi:hypothetical protein
MPSLIGNKPNQVPTNGDLGTLAFQDANAVNITGGVITASGAFSANGGTTLGDASGDALTINSSAVSIPNGLNFDSNTFVIDATNNRVGVGTASPSRPLHVVGDSWFGSSSTTDSYVARFYNQNSNLYIGVDNAAGSNTGVAYNTYFLGLNAYPMTFYTNSTERMRITSAGNVGIGTSSPAFKLDLNGIGAIRAGNAIRYYRADNGIYTELYDAGSSGGFTSNNANGDGFRWQNGSSTTVMTLNSSGNLGLGVTPSAWGSGQIASQIRNSALMSFDINDSTLAHNAFHNGTSWLYSSTTFASRYRQASGAHAFFTAPSGTAGNAITFTQAMTLNASGNLGIGVTSPAANYKLHVAGDIRIGNAGSETGALQISQESTQALIQTRYNQPLLFGTGTIERMRIDSSGNLLVGTTSQVASARFSLNRSDAGVVAGFRTVVDSGTVTMLGFLDGDSVTCGTITIDTSANTTAYNTSSDARLKNDIGVATDTSVIDNTIIHDFSWKSNGSIDRGVFAQEAKLVKPSAVSVGTDETNEDGNLVSPWGVDYSKYVPDLIVYCQQLKKQMQEQQAIINDLKARIETLESK